MKNKGEPRPSDDLCRRHRGQQTSEEEESYDRKGRIVQGVSDSHSCFRKSFDGADPAANAV